MVIADDNHGSSALHVQCIKNFSGIHKMFICVLNERYEQDEKDWRPQQEHRPE